MPRYRSQLMLAGTWAVVLASASPTCRPAGPDTPNAQTRPVPANLAPSTRPGTELIAPQAEANIVANTDGQRTPDGWTYDGGLSEPQWSPDGRRIAFTKNLIKYRPEKKTWHGTYELWTATPDGKEVRRLARGLKLFWRSPHEIVYVRWSEKAGGGLLTHFASMDVRTGRRRDLAEKPAIPKVTLRWKGRDYSILDTAAHNERMADPERVKLIKALAGQVCPPGLRIGDVDIRGAVVLVSTHYMSVDAPPGNEICHVRSEADKPPRVLVRDAGQPALAPDRRTIAFVRDGDIWLTRLHRPLEPTATRPSSSPAGK